MIKSKISTLQVIVIVLVVILPIGMMPFLPDLKHASALATKENAYYWEIFRNITVWGIAGIGGLEIVKWMIPKPKTKLRYGH